MKFPITPFPNHITIWRHVTGETGEKYLKKHFHNHYYNPHGMTRFPIATQTNLFAALISRKTRHVTGKKLAKNT